MGELRSGSTSFHMTISAIACMSRTESAITRGETNHAATICFCVLLDHIIYQLNKLRKRSEFKCTTYVYQIHGCIKLCLQKLETFLVLSQKLLYLYINF